MPNSQIYSVQFESADACQSFCKLLRPRGIFEIQTIRSNSCEVLAPERLAADQALAVLLLSVDVATCPRRVVSHLPKISITRSDIADIWWLFEQKYHRQVPRSQIAQLAKAIELKQPAPAEWLLHWLALAGGESPRIDRA